MSATSHLLKLMFPILITQVAQAGYGLVDTIMAGRVSAEDLAVVSIGAGLWMPVMFFGVGILMATTPILGELIGQKKHHQIAHMTQQSLWLAAVVGFISFFILWVLPFSFSWFDVPSTLQTGTAFYLRSVAFGFIAIVLSTSLRCYTESLGHVLPVTFISLFGVLLDIPLNYIFIHGKLGMPALGGAGCGVATAIVMWLTFFMMVGYISWSKSYKTVRFYSQFARPQKESIKKIAVLGLPIGTAIFFEASLFTMASVVLSPLGAVTVAAHQVALSVTSQLFNLPLSLSFALTIVVSRLYGEKNWQALKHMQRIGFIVATSLAVVGMLIILLARDIIVTWFSTDTNVVALAANLLIFAALYQIVDAWQVTSAGVLRGIQDTATPMVITFISYWCVALPLGVYLARFTNYGAMGFWSALVVGLTLASFLMVRRVLQQNKKFFTHMPNNKVS